MRLLFGISLLPPPGARATSRSIRFLQRRRRQARRPTHPSAAIQLNAAPDDEQPADEAWIGTDPGLVESGPFASTPPSAGGTVPASEPGFTPASGGDATGSTTSATTACRNDASAAEMYAGAGSPTGDSPKMTA